MEKIAFGIEIVEKDVYLQVVCAIYLLVNVFPFSDQLS